MVYFEAQYEQAVAPVQQQVLVNLFQSGVVS